jgi:hypothetical protein
MSNKRAAFYTAMNAASVEVGLMLAIVNLVAGRYLLSAALVSVSIAAGLVAAGFYAEIKD